MSREGRLYTLLAVATPIAIAAAITAWAQDNLRTVGALAIVLLCWSVGVLIIAREIKKRRSAGEINYSSKAISRFRRVIPLIERVFWLLVLIFCIASLSYALVSDKSLYVVLEIVFVMLISGGHLLFVSLVPNE